MANRPVYVPLNRDPYVREQPVEFLWVAGMAVSQAQKCIRSWHEAAQRQGIHPVLEISSKSPEALGVQLSAFNLMLKENGQDMSVECAFQGSKVFHGAGPFTDLYRRTSREARTDHRLRESGQLQEFRFLGESFPLRPVTAFYDWLYLRALSQNTDVARGLLAFQGFTDIAFNPKKSLNCQARAAALYVGLSRAGKIDGARDRASYFAMVGSQAVQGQLL